MIVIIDTNVLVTLNYFLNSVKSRKLLKSCKMGLIELIVPDVVLNETLQKYREALLGICASEKKLYKKKKQLLINVEKPESLLDVENACQQYSVFLTSLFEEHRVTVVDAPIVPQQEMLQRAIKKIRPFSTQGAGYRDFLIWKTVVAVAKVKGGVVFCSSNTKDFAEGKDKKLHHNFIADLRDADVPEESVEYISTIDALISDRIDPLHASANEKVDSLFKTGRIEEQLSSWLDAHGDAELSSFIETYEDSSAETTMVDCDDLKILDGFRSVQFAQDSVFVELTATATFYLEFFMEKSEYYSMDESKEEDFEVLDGNWNDYVMLCGRTAKMRLKFSVDYEDGSFSDPDINLWDAEKLG